MSRDYREYTILLFYFMRLSVFRKIFFCKSNRIGDTLRAAAEPCLSLHLLIHGRYRNRFFFEFLDIGAELL